MEPTYLTLTDETFAAMDAAETLSERLHRQVRKVIAGMADEVGDRFTVEILRGPGATLTARMCEAISTNDYTAGMKALDAYIAEVRAVLINERAFGRLKVMSKFDKVARWKTQLARCSFGSAEKSTVIDSDALMDPDDDIADVTYDGIVLSSGVVITRDMIRQHCRRELQSNLISDAKLRAVQDAPRKVSAPSTGWTDAQGHFTPLGGEA